MKKQKPAKNTQPHTRLEELEESASCRVAKVLISDDFPAPFGPNKPNMPLLIPKEIFWRAFGSHKKSGDKG